jgi:hypothetical protein
MLSGPTLLQITGSNELFDAAHREKPSNDETNYDTNNKHLKSLLAPIYRAPP